MRKSLFLEGAALGAALVFFLALALYQLDLPGLYYDEAADAVLAVQLLQGQPVELFRGAGLWIGDRAFPLMVMDYVGAVNSYLLVPVFAALGTGVISLRLLTVLGSALALVLTYLLARSLFGWVAAALAVLLLAVHPSFVFWSRQGVYVTSIMAPLALGGLLCLRRWHGGGSSLRSADRSPPDPGPGKGLLSGDGDRHAGGPPLSGGHDSRRNPAPGKDLLSGQGNPAPGGRSLYFVLGLFLLGLGISAKLLFLWVLVAAGILYLVLSRKPISMPQGLGGLAALAFGAGLPVLYNLQGQGTFALLSRNLLKTEQGVDNLATLSNLTTRAGDLVVLLDGGFFWFLGGLFRSPPFPYVFLGAAALLVLLAALPAGSAWPRPFRLAPDPHPSLLPKGEGAVPLPSGLDPHPSLVPEGEGDVSAPSGLDPHPSLLLKGEGDVPSPSGLDPHPSLLLKGEGDVPAPSGIHPHPSLVPEGEGAVPLPSGLDLHPSLVPEGEGAVPPPSGFDPHPSLLSEGEGGVPSPRWERARVRASQAPGSYRKAVALLLGFILLVFLQSAVTISGLWPTHFFVLLPFAAMVIGSLVWLLPRALPWTRPARVVALALWAAVFLSSLGVDLQYHGALAETGGWMAHSDAVYRLAEALERRGDTQPVAMDWGIKASVQVLTQGRVNPQEVFQYQPEPDQTFFDLTYKAMQDPKRLYVFRAGELTVFPRFEPFQSLVKRLGKTAVLEETITQRDGRPLYLVYTAR